MVRCTSCNRAMLINNCYMEINTTFQLETTEKQFTVMANQTTLSTYLGEDVYKYKDNIDDLTEKHLLLENVDFKLSTNARMITEIVDHQKNTEMNLRKRCTIVWFVSCNCLVLIYSILNSLSCSRINRNFSKRQLFLTHSNSRL